MLPTPTPRAKRFPHRWTRLTDDGRGWGSDGHRWRPSAQLAAAARLAPRLPDRPGGRSRRRLRDHADRGRWHVPGQVAGATQGDPRRVPGIVDRPVGSPVAPEQRDAHRSPPGAGSRLGDRRREEHRVDPGRRGLAEVTHLGRHPHRTHPDLDDAVRKPDGGDAPPRRCRRGGRPPPRAPVAPRAGARCHHWGRWRSGPSGSSGPE